MELNVKAQFIKHYKYESLLVGARKEFDKFVLLDDIKVYVSLSTQSYLLLKI
jgi:hypothetical protein